jgi:ABC-type lipoprotein export system ATPase subunit
MEEEKQEQLQYIIDKYDIKDYTEPPIKIPSFENKDGIVLIVGSSGSGKSTILRSVVSDKKVVIDYDKNIIENFSSPDRAEELLLAVGLRSIPTWFRPFNMVSNGEKHRAESALAIDQGINYIDEFTSVVDRDTAKSLSVAINKYYSGKNETIYIATPHDDVEEWLIPDIIYDTDKQEFKTKEYLRRPEIKLDIESSTVKDWVYFEKHHYLDSNISKGVHSYIATINGKKVGYLGIIHGTGRDIPTYWRESRLVVLPEFQGLGIGKVLSDTIGQIYVDKGLRYFCKTAHPALGIYRDNTPLWRATSTNHQKRKSFLNKDGTPRLCKGYGKSAELILRDANRMTYSHEFMGDGKSEERNKLIVVVKKPTLDDWI